MSNNYIMDPMTCRIQFAFRNSYNQAQDEYKYRIAIVNEKVRINISPNVLKDIMKYQQYLEGYTYLYDLQRFRPQIKVQAFIDYRKKHGKLPKDVDIKRKAVIRDWFKLVLWYIRLKKTAHGSTPHSILQIEERI